MLITQHGILPQIIVILIGVTLTTQAGIHQIIRQSTGVMLIIQTGQIGGVTTIPKSIGATWTSVLGNPPTTGILTGVTLITQHGILQIMRQLTGVMLIIQTGTIGGLMTTLKSTGAM